MSVATRADLDLFPATIETPQGRFSMARLWVRDGLARIFVARGREVQLIYEASGVTDIEPGAGRRKPYAVSFEDGGIWEAVRAGSCGCGSPLKKFDPGGWK